MSQGEKYPWRKVLVYIRLFSFFTMKSVLNRKKSIVLSEKGIGVVTVREYIRLAISLPRFWGSPY